MSKEEIKQWLRSQIDSSLLIQNGYNKNVFYLYYNNSYVRALKLSKITGKPVNKNDFKGGEKLFLIDIEYNEIYHYKKIKNYLDKNHSRKFFEKVNILEEVLNEYTEYKDYKCI